MRGLDTWARGQPGHKPKSPSGVEGKTKSRSIIKARSTTTKVGASHNMGKEQSLKIDRSLINQDSLALKGRSLYSAAPHISRPLCSELIRDWEVFIKAINKVGMFFSLSK